MVPLHKQPKGVWSQWDLLSCLVFPALPLCICPASEKLWGKEIECERELVIGIACSWDCPDQWMLWQRMCRSKGLWPRYHTSQSALIPSITYRVSLSHRVVPASANTHTHASEFPLFPLGLASAPFIKILYLFIWLTAKPHLLCLLGSVLERSGSVRYLTLYSWQFYCVISQFCTTSLGTDPGEVYELHTNWQGL